MTSAGSGDALRHDLIRRAGQLTSTVNELAFDHLAGRPSDGFALLGAGAPAIDDALAQLEPRATRSVWSMYPVTRFHPLDPAQQLNDRSGERGLDLRTVVSEHCLTVNPLISSIRPGLRIGHVFSTFILIDRSTAVLFGPPTEKGEPTAWRCTEPSLLDTVSSFWDLVWDTSRPAVPPGEAPPFTPRQVVIASRMTVGTKDAAIARELGVSIRTVVAEVALIVDKLGARGRVDAILRMGSGSPEHIMGRQLG